jgi:hypothetical protein
VTSILKSIIYSKIKYIDIYEKLKIATIKKIENLCQEVNQACLEMTDWVYQNSKQILEQNKKNLWIQIAY